MSQNQPRPSYAPRASIFPSGSTQSVTNASSASSVRSRHLSHLHSQLAQLSANLADLENLVKATSTQAESMRGLGGYSAGLFMAASKILGEETVASRATNPSSSENAGSQRP